MIVGAYYDWLFVAEESKVGAVLNRFRLAPDQVLAEYEEAERRLNKKQGVGPRTGVGVPAQKPQPGERAVPGPPDSQNVPLRPPLNYDLFREIVLSRVSDKAGFFVASSELAANRRGELARFGELREVRTKGETAIGRTTFIDYHLSSDFRAEKPRKVYTSVSTEIRFRKLNGRWFVGD